MFFFTQDLVSQAATSDFDQSLQVLDACDFLRLCDWQLSSHFTGSSHSTTCSSLALQVNCALSLAKVKQNICNIVCLKLVLTCILYQKCVNVRLLGMRVQIKRLYTFQACIFNESSFTLFRHTRLELNSRTLSTEGFNSVCSHFSLTNISRNAGDTPLARVNACKCLV